MVDARDYQEAQFRGAIEEVVNGRQRDAVAKYFTPDLITHHPTQTEALHGTEAYLELLSTAWEAFPDYKLTINELIAGEDALAARCTSTGTLVHPFAGFKPTGKPFSVPELLYLRYVDGRSSEIWSMPDMMRQMAQMGLMPEGPPPKPMVFAMQLAQRLTRKKR